MNRSQLLTALTLAGNDVVDAINRRMPADSVPDRVALPILNRLEREHTEAEQAFVRVRCLIRQLPRQWSDGPEAA